MLLSCNLLHSQPVERIYVSTDRNSYIAGENIGCSLFLMEAGTAGLSSFSAVAYMELISADGTAATGKTALAEGRGASLFHIPEGTPTGNYKLVAYTALNANEKGNQWQVGSKTISVFNTTSTARVKDGVNVVSSLSVSPVKAQDGPLYISKITNISRSNPFSIRISSTRAASFSLSVVHEDSLQEIQQDGIESFKYAVKRQQAKADVTGKRLPEYEGEIIYASVEGLEDASYNLTATLSSADSPSDMYLGRTSRKGQVIFYTSNIYGDRELVCEIEGAEGYVSLDSPFIHPEITVPEPLQLCYSQQASLLQRKTSLMHPIKADTLFSFLPRRQDFLLESLPVKRYHLDDYRRFPSFQEVLVEIIPELKISSRHQKKVLILTRHDSSSGQKNSYDNILTMLDGVAISDLTIIQDMDALLLEDVDIYTESFLIGGVSFNGAVNFITRKNYVTAIDFPSGVRVVDFQGVSYPLAYFGDTFPSYKEDFRQVLYWNPLQQLKPSLPLELQLKAPSYSGRFLIIAEGITENGDAFRQICPFEVK